MSLAEHFAPAKPEEAARRRAICATCPTRAGRLLSLSVCKACGCPIASKTALKSSTCPLGKWEQADADVRP